MLATEARTVPVRTLLVRMLTSLCQDSQAGWNAKIVCEKTELALRECASA